jgi:plasmid stability protein
MDTTIRNLDETAYRELKARAALSGKPVGELVNEAIRKYLGQQEPRLRKGKSILDWRPIPFPPGNEHLSEEIDKILYGGEADLR